MNAYTQDVYRREHAEDVFNKLQLLRGLLTAITASLPTPANLTTVEQQIAISLLETFALKCECQQLCNVKRELAQQLREADARGKRE